MPRLAYLFERFPSFTQTFCYREVAELRRQGISPAIFSIRKPAGEPAQEWDPAIVSAVEYLPVEEKLVSEIDRAVRKRRLPDKAARTIADWGRQTDFLRLYQAAWLGARLEAIGVRHIHAHFAGMAARTAYWVERFFGTGFSFTAHANDFLAPKPFAISLADLVTAARAVVTVSDFGLDLLRTRFPAAAPKFHRIYNGIDLRRFPPSDFSAEPPLIISVGRLIEKKGFADLIEACRLLRERRVDFRCEIIGDGPLQTELADQIRRNDLLHAVHLKGALAQPELIRRLASATVFALPSVLEAGGGMDNLPTVIMEAMAAGLPVVATNVAGLPEMVQDGVTGLLVAERQPGAVAEAIARLLADPSLLQSLGAAGRRRATELFSIDQTAGQLIALFRSIAGDIGL